MTQDQKIELLQKITSAEDFVFTVELLSTYTDDDIDLLFDNALKDLSDSLKNFTVLFSYKYQVRKKHDS